MQIKVENLLKQYGRITAVDISDLQIEKGQIFGLVGNNGAGKTTFLRLVLDLVEATEGQVLVDRKNVAKDSSWKAITGLAIHPMLSWRCPPWTKTLPLDTLVRRTSRFW